MLCQTAYGSKTTRKLKTLKSLEATKWNDQSVYWEIRCAKTAGLLAVVGWKWITIQQILRF